MSDPPAVIEIVIFPRWIVFPNGFTQTVPSWWTTAPSIPGTSPHHTRITT